LNGNVKGKTIGLPKEFFVSGTDPQVEAAVKLAAKKFEELGAKIVEISLPHSKYAVPCYYIIAPAEASSNLARYDGIRYGYRTKNFNELEDLFKNTRTEGFGAQVSLRIVVGTYVLSSGYYDAYYLRAQKVRTLIKNDFIEAFKKCDAILAPTATETAFRLGEKSNDNVKMYLNDIFTAPVNLAGLPSISVPCGFSSENMPIGLQIIGKHLCESEILNTAYAYEQATDWHKQRPNFEVHREEV
jgi:aspartyl-tRNA(Asn)/glutamyl-tRNA(Gln) amidotransferase subunit A